LTTPIRVARIITRLNIGGPSIQAIELSVRLRSRGFETTLVFGTLDPHEGDMTYLIERGQSRPDSVSIPTLQRKMAPSVDVRALWKVYRLLCEVKPAIVHTHMAKAGALGRAAALAYNETVGRAAPARVVHTYHGHVLDGYFSPAKTRMFVGIERRLARATDRIIAVSPRIRDELLEAYRIGRPDQYRVVPLGFDLDPLLEIDEPSRVRARAALHIPASAAVVATVGRLTAIKDQRLFLEAAQLVSRANPSSVFLVAGDGELRGELEATARALGLGDRVRFLGWRRDLETVYGATDVFLLTSRSEGTPVALIESLAAGVPVVSTDVGGVRDVVDSEDIGLVRSWGDADQLAAAVKLLLPDAARRHAMGERGREAMIARYGIVRLMDDMERLYRELLA
jgi:glycosyltransferase involved in cell wall biosynthesis